MSFKILDPDKTIDIPADVAVCPYCKTKITISPDGWVEEEDGFVCDSFTSWCETEPEIDASSGEWDKFLYSHDIMPYVYQLPVDQEIGAWLKSRYRFNLPTQRESRQTPGSLDETQSNCALLPKSPN